MAYTWLTKVAKEKLYPKHVTGLQMHYALDHRQFQILIKKKQLFNSHSKLNWISPFPWALGKSNFSRKNFISVLTAREKKNIVCHCDREKEEKTVSLCFREKFLKAFYPRECDFDSKSLFLLLRCLSCRSFLCRNPYQNNAGAKKQLLMTQPKLSLIQLRRFQLDKKPSGIFLAVTERLLKLLFVGVL